MMCPILNPYLDLRDLDVFPSIFFENVFFIYQAPTAQQRDGKTPWQFADEIDTFNYVMLLNSPIFQKSKSSPHTSKQKFCACLRRYAKFNLCQKNIEK